MGIGTGKKALVIDDETLLRLQLVTILKLSGFEVHEAHDGSQGIEMCQKLKPDLVVTDIHMPKTNGIELVKALRLTPERPIIIVTSAKWNSDGIDYLKLAKEFEVHGVLAKPIVKEILLKKIEPFFKEK